MFGLTMLVPWGLSWVLHDGAESAFDEAVLLTIGTGAGLWYATRKEKRDLTVRDGFLMVALVWTVLPAYAGLPLIIHLGASFTDAYFETVSGLTTTGSTVFEGLDQFPVSINFWPAARTSAKAGFFRPPTAKRISFRCRCPTMRSRRAASTFPPGAVSNSTAWYTNKKTPSPALRATPSSQNGLRSSSRPM